MIIIDSIKKWWKKLKEGNIPFGPGVKKSLFGLIFFLVVIFILTVNLSMDPNGGEVRNREFTAPQTIAILDQGQEEASEIYVEEPEVSQEIKDDISTIFSLIRENRSLDIDEEAMEEEAEESDESDESDESEESEESEDREEESEIQVTERINSEISGSLSPATVKILVEIEEEELEEVEETALSVMDRQLEEGIFPEATGEAASALGEMLREQEFSEELSSAIEEVLLAGIQPNMFLDEEATQEHQGELAENIRTIRRGEVVSEEDLEMLAALGLNDSGINDKLGIVVIVLILMTLVSYYIYKYEPELWQDNTKLLLLELLVVLVLIIAKIISIFPSSYLMYLVPAAMASVIAAVLIDSRAAVITTIFLSFLVAMVFGSYFELVLISFVSGMVGIYSVQNVSQRGDFVRAGLYVSGVLVVLIFGLNLFGMQRYNILEMAYPLGMGLLNGLLVAIFTNGFLPGLENIFGLTSAVKLLELSNPSSQPLLKRLQMEAPGSYQHSINVGNLAETAADNIGADSLLTRVGAYYHDIGKLKRPYFFTDNQFGAENPHDKISANLSSLIIKSHVKDGVEMAEKYKLPRAVKDIIREHHGTNLISFFYQQALEDSKHNTVEESDFRYDGPRPHSREAAIIMLADVVEAAIKSKRFDKSDHNRIESIVRGLIREKLIHGQLDNSSLTLKDLDLIGESFVKVLTGIYHQRVEYPENLMQEMKRADNSD
ncbi:MAG: HD family phosphohydrolase [Halanaerobiales bacterium]